MQIKMDLSPDPKVRPIRNTLLGVFRKKRNDRDQGMITLSVAKNAKRKPV